MQEKMHLLSFGIQKSFENWNSEIPGTNIQIHSNWHKASMNSMELLNMLKNTFKTSRIQSGEIYLFGQFCPWDPNGTRFSNLKF